MYGLLYSIPHGRPRIGMIRSARNFPLCPSLSPSQVSHETLHPDLTLCLTRPVRVVIS